MLIYLHSFHVTGGDLFLLLGGGGVVQEEELENGVSSEHRLTASAVFALLPLNSGCISL